MASPPANRAIEARQVDMNREAISNAFRTKAARGWQLEAQDKILELFSQQDLCVVECVTGGGKTFFASRLAAYFLAEGSIDEVVIIAPSTPIKQNWASTMDAFNVTCISANYATSGVTSYAITYSGAFNKEVSIKLAQNKKRFLIVDEFHHAERDAPWGEAVDDIAKKSQKVLMLTGTPWRSDGEIALLKNNGYYQNGIVKPDFAYKYRQDLDAVGDNRATVYVHFNFFDSKAKNKNTGELVEFTTAADRDQWLALMNENDSRPLGMHVTIADERLSNNTMARTMLKDAILKLERSKAKETNGRAIGLVVARNIQEARRIEHYLTETLDQRAEVIASDDERASERLAEIKRLPPFRSPDWIVSVGMVSEGVDIPQIKVIVYLSGIMTLLYISQVIGRCMRRINIGDAVKPKYLDNNPGASPGYVFMPAHPYLLWIASKFEEDVEYSQKNKKDGPPKDPADRSPSQSDWFNEGGTTKCEMSGGTPFDPALTRMIELLEEDENASKVCNAMFCNMVREWIRNGESEHAEEELRRYCKKFQIQFSAEPLKKTITTDEEIRYLKSESKKLVAKIRFRHADYRERPKNEDSDVYKDIRRIINKKTGIKRFDAASLEQMRKWVAIAQQMLGA